MGVTNHIAWAPHSSSHLLCGNNNGFSVLEVGPHSRQPEQLHRLQTSLRHITDSEVHQAHWFTRRRTKKIQALRLGWPRRWRYVKRFLAADGLQVLSNYIKFIAELEITALT